MIPFSGPLGLGKWARASSPHREFHIRIWVLPRLSTSLSIAQLSAQNPSSRTCWKTSDSSCPSWHWAPPKGSSSWILLQRTSRESAALCQSFGRGSWLWHGLPPWYPLCWFGWWTETDRWWIPSRRWSERWGSLEARWWWFWGWLNFKVWLFEAETWYNTIWTQGSSAFWIRDCLLKLL